MVSSELGSHTTFRSVLSRSTGLVILLTEMDEHDLAQRYGRIPERGAKRSGVHHSGNATCRWYYLLD